MASAIEDFELDLSDINVLTEAGSATFAVTPLIAAMAGANYVFAVSRDSQHGRAADIFDYVRSWAGRLGVRKQIEFSTCPPADHAPDSHLVTNLGFVRPLDRDLLRRLPPDAAIALMWEPWELRDADIDVIACREFDVPVLGTKETHHRLMTFRYVGMLALKLLLEAKIEVFQCSIAVVGSDPFGCETARVLESLDANVIRIPAAELFDGEATAMRDRLAGVDAIVLVEHRDHRMLISEGGCISAKWLADNAVTLVHICGRVDLDAVRAASVNRIPENSATPGSMTLTTEYVGPRPVVDLHAAGLRVGELLVRGRRDFGDTRRAVASALASGLALELEPANASETQ